MLASLTASRVAFLYPPSLLSALQARPAQRTRANLGGVAARALINLASSSPGGGEAVRKAGGMERLWMLGWGTTDEGVQAVVREGIALLEGAEVQHAEATLTSRSAPSAQGQQQKKQQGRTEPPLLLRRAPSSATTR